MANERDVKLGLGYNPNKGGRMFDKFVGKLYLPSVTRDGALINASQRERVLSLVCRTFSEKFGGATVTEGRGYYVNFDGNLVTEPVTIIETITDSDPSSILDNIADYVKETLRQECVLYTVEPVKAAFV